MVWAYIWRAFSKNYTHFQWLTRPVDLLLLLILWTSFKTLGLSLAMSVVVLQFFVFFTGLSCQPYFHQVLNSELSFYIVCLLRYIAQSTIFYPLLEEEEMASCFSQGHLFKVKVQTWPEFKSCLPIPLSMLITIIQCEHPVDQLLHVRSDFIKIDIRDNNFATNCGRVVYPLFSPSIIFSYQWWDLYLCISYEYTTGNLFIVLKACVGPASFFRWADNRLMVYQCATDSVDHHSSHFEFKVFHFQSTQLFTLERRDSFMFFSRSLVQSKYKQLCLGFELGSLNLFPTMLSVTACMSPLLYVLNWQMCKITRERNHFNWD